MPATRRRLRCISNPKRTEVDGSSVVEIEPTEYTDVEIVEEVTKDGHKKSKQVTKKHQKRYRESRKFVFLLGALIGVFVAVYFGSKSSIDLDNLDLENFVNFDKFINFENVQEYFDDWRVSLPTGLQTMVAELQNQRSQPNFSESFAVGKSLQKEHNITAKYPVVMVPGVTSAGIESWSLEGTEECPSRHHFRKRLWGSMYMLRTMFLDKACWLKHIKLDPETGLDPPGIKLRAAQGFEATDYFMAGYWIWNKILENLAAIGYEPNQMLTASYDWRLSYLDLERRDSYFSKLKNQIELHLQRTGERTVLVGHSMGSQVSFYFLKWVEAEGENFGNGGAGWVNKHVKAYVDISGSMLGAPKAVTAILSGEVKDTVQLNALAVYGLEKFFSRRERVDMIKSFGAGASMMPKGGDFIWGNSSFAFEDQNDNLSSDLTHGNFIKFYETIGEYSTKNLTMDDVIDYVFKNSPEWYVRRTREHYSYGLAKTVEELEANNQDYSKWANPLEAALPNAPDMKVFCFYGVNNPTERSYVYQEESEKEVSRLNVSIKAPTDKQRTVFFTDGDGTVPLVSHAMCHKWKDNTAFNPGGSEVKIVELKHDPDRFDIRGGAKTAEHVDVLGSSLLNELVLKVASGRDDLIEENLITELGEWVKTLDFGI